MHQRIKQTDIVSVMYLNYSMEIGGIETHLYEVACRLNSDEFLPSICVLKGGGTLERRLESKDIAVYDLCKREGIDLAIVLKLRKLLLEKGIRILHTNNYSAWLYGVLAALGIRSLKHVHAEHAIIDIKRRARIERLLSYFTDSIVCVSGGVRDYMMNYQKITPRRLTVIYNGIDTDRFSRNPETRKEYRKQLGISDGSPVVGIIARLNPIKDHATLLKAFSKVSQTLPDAVLLIVGGGEMEDALVSQASALNITEKVIFLGERNDIPGLLNVIDVFVLSSLSEAHNVSLLEAMSSELPVVATRVGGNTEIVDENVTGFLVPPKDSDTLAVKIMDIIVTEEHKNNMGAKGRAKVLEKFTIDRMMNNYISLYKKLLNS